MVGADLFYADRGREREVMRKGTAREGTADATGRGLRAAVPEAGGEGRGGGRALAPASSLSERSGLSVPAVVIQWWYE